MSKVVTLDGQGGSFVVQDPPRDDVASRAINGERPVLITSVILVEEPRGDDRYLGQVKLSLGTGMIPTIWIDAVHLWPSPWPLALWVPPRQDLSAWLRGNHGKRERALPIALRFTWERTDLGPRR